MISSRIVAVAMLVSMGGCSTVMEANRPSAVNLKRFSPGQKHLDVISVLGAPQMSEKDSDKNCDVYRLYTKGTSKTGKGAIIVGEAAADVFTLGLFEVVATPGEALTKSNAHVVLFCYSEDNLLVSVTDSGRKIGSAGVGASAQGAAPPAPAPAVKAAPAAPAQNPR